MAERILVVEDETLVLMATSDALREGGFDVVEAMNADEAMTQLDRDRTIRLLFSDVRMPGTMDGFQLARWTAERRPDIKVVITSGEIGNGQPPAGFDWRRDFVPKPYRLADLVGIIRAAVDKPAVHPLHPASGAAISRSPSLQESASWPSSPTNPPSSSVPASASARRSPAD